MYEELVNQIEIGDVYAFKQLIGKCSENEVGNDIKEELFVMSCENGQLDIVKHLVENEVDMETKGGLGLESACANGHLDVVEYLIEKGVDVVAGDNKAVQIAILVIDMADKTPEVKKQYKIVECLLKNGANFDKCEAAIGTAFKKKAYELIKLFVQYDVKYNKEVAFTSACSGGDSVLISLLIKEVSKDHIGEVLKYCNLNIDIRHLILASK